MPKKKEWDYEQGLKADGVILDQPVKDKKQKSLNLYAERLWMNLGWYKGDPFKLFCVTIWETGHSYDFKRVDHITVLSFQTLYFVFAFGWRSY